MGLGGIERVRALIGSDDELVRVGALGPRQSSNGQLQVLRPPGADSESQDLVLKTLQQGGAQDAFAWHVARAFGVEDMFLPTAWSDVRQGALMERFDGRTLSDRRLNGASGLRSALEGHVRTIRPELTERAAQHEVSLRSERLVATKAFLADGDWHEMNVLQGSGDDRRIAHIDSGLMNQYAPGADGIPTLKANIAAGMTTYRSGNGVYELPLSAATLTGLERVERSSIERPFQRMIERIGGRTDVGRRFAEPLTLEQLPQMWARLDDAIVHEAVRFRVG